MRDTQAPPQTSIGPPPPAPPEGASIEPVLPLPFPLEPRGKARPSVCVVLPAFNEEAVLPRTYRVLAETLDALDVEWTLLFVNDGSRDGTAGVLEQLYRQDERVGYLLLSRNFGHQAALTAGLDHANADVVISMDADLQHPPELLATMLGAWREGYDVVHTRKLATVGLSTRRSLVTRWAYRLISMVAQVDLIEQASDYRLLDRSVLDALRSLPETGRLYRGLTPWLGFRQCVLPYVAAERAAGTSQYGLRQLFGLFTRALFDFSDVPLHAGLVLGGIAIGLSALYFLYVVVWALVGESTPPGWASTVSVTLLLNSITLGFLGIIGVYVARIYNEVRARPTYLLSRVRIRSGD
ncbi:MAG TPA: glycosyltransferase family 2 protein [Gemmatimonadaceae bacterium]|nr:glycosyltransferase family 2 protein [Gemmatimonadaceae bacterium]